MLVLAVGIWCVVVYSFRVAFFGNPLYNQLQRTDTAVIEGAEEAATEGLDRTTQSEALFLQRFSRLSLLELGAFLLEIGLLVYLLVAGTLFWLSLVLLMKNVVMVAVSFSFARMLTDGEGLFRSMRQLPRWLVWLDRASATVSGCGFLYVFVTVSGLLNAG